MGGCCDNGSRILSPVKEDCGSDFRKPDETTRSHSARLLLRRRLVGGGDRLPELAELAIRLVVLARNRRPEMLVQEGGRGAAEIGVRLARSGERSKRGAAAAERSAAALVTAARDRRDENSAAADRGGAREARRSDESDFSIGRRPGRIDRGVQSFQPARNRRRLGSAQPCLFSAGHVRTALRAVVKRLARGRPGGQGGGGS